MAEQALGVTGGEPQPGTEVSEMAKRKTHEECTGQEALARARHRLAQRVRYDPGVRVNPRHPGRCDSECDHLGFLTRNIQACPGQTPCLGWRVTPEEARLLAAMWATADI